MPDIPANLAVAMRRAALLGAEQTMRFFQSDDLDIARKADSSPVTEGDLAAHRTILAALTVAFPKIPVISEEGAPETKAVPETPFFLIDPLDGTKEYSSGRGEFTVNIALIELGRPVLGVVFAPALNKLFVGERSGAWSANVDADGSIKEKQAIRARPSPAAGLVAVASRSHRSPETDAYLNTLDVADFKAAGSSLKFCLLAAGVADVYPRFGRTMEWDTAAGQAVLEAAGGQVLTHPEGAALKYGKSQRGFDNPHFIAWGVR